MIPLDLEDLKPTQKKRPCPQLERRSRTPECQKIVDLKRPRNWPSHWPNHSSKTLDRVNGRCIELRHTTTEFVSVNQAVSVELDGEETKIIGGIQICYWVHALGCMIREHFTNDGGWHKMIAAGAE